MANFYVPTLSMLYIYGRIFRTIRQRGRKDLGEVTAASSTSTKRTTTQSAAETPTAAAAGAVSENVDSTSFPMTEGGVQESPEGGETAAPTTKPRTKKKRRIKAARWWRAKRGDQSTVSSDDVPVTAGSMEPRGTPSNDNGRLMDLYESLTLLELHQVTSERGGADVANGGGSASHYNNVRVNVEYVDSSEAGATRRSRRTTNGRLVAETDQQAQPPTPQPSRGGLVKSGNSTERTTVLISLKERKAARQLGVIMCAFIVCWLPYFIVFLVVAGCQECVDDTLFRITLWLGYVNSTLNPVLYPLCNANFRRAFAKMLAKSCCRTSHHSQHQTHPLVGAVLPPHSSRY